MKEAVIEFRKMCKVLIDEKGYTADKICTETGLSWSTYDKLMKADLQEKCGIRASTVGIIQDFHKKHVNDLRYSGIEPGETKPAKKAKKPEAPETPEAIKAEIGQTNELIVKRDLMSSFAEVLTEMSKILPFNVTINIAINGGNEK